MPETRCRKNGVMEDDQGWILPKKHALQVQLFAEETPKDVELYNSDPQSFSQNTIENGRLAADLIEERYNVDIDALQGFQLIQTCLNALDTGNARVMLCLAFQCAEGRVSVDQTQEIANDMAFKAQLCKLANNYARGFAEPDNDQTAFQIFKQVEAQNDPDVLCAIAKYYQFGYGVEQDISKAIEHYIQSAMHGLFEAMELLYTCKGQHTDDKLKAAFQYFKHQADQGDLNALFSVAHCYCWGIGVECNNELSAQILAEATRRGNLNAASLYAGLYEKGRGVVKDKPKAYARHYDIAGKGNRWSQYRLAWSHFLGTGGDKDFESAVFWYTKAALQGDSESARQLGNCYTYGNGVAQDDGIAFQYYKQAAIIGNNYGQYHCGRCYHDGRGVKRNFKRAAYWFKKAAEQGNVDKTGMFEDCQKRIYKVDSKSENAQNASDRNIAGLAEMRSKATQQQLEIAFYLAKLAAVNGCREAFELLGDCFYYGCGVARDYRAAAVNYEQAEISKSEILFRLAECHQSGETDGNEVDEFSVVQRANAALRREIDTILAQMQ